MQLYTLHGDIENRIVDLYKPQDILGCGLCSSAVLLGDDGGIYYEASNGYKKLQNYALPTLSGDLAVQGNYTNVYEIDELGSVYPEFIEIFRQVKSLLKKICQKVDTLQGDEIEILLGDDGIFYGYDGKDNAFPILQLADEDGQEVGLDAFEHLEDELGRGFSFKGFKMPKMKFKLPKIPKMPKIPKFKIPKFKGLTKGFKNLSKGISKSVKSVSKGISRAAKDYSKGISRAAKDYSKAVSKNFKNVGKALSNAGEGLSDILSTMGTPPPQEEPEQEQVQEYVDENGNPVDENGYPLEQEQVQEYVDENGNPVDENGYPLEQEQAQEFVDENGNPVDENGYPLEGDLGFDLSSLMSMASGSGGAGGLTSMLPSLAQGLSTKQGRTAVGNKAIGMGLNALLPGAGAVYESTMSAYNQGFQNKKAQKKLDKAKSLKLLTSTLQKAQAKPKPKPVKKIVKAKPKIIKSAITNPERPQVYDYTNSTPTETKKDNTVLYVVGGAIAIGGFMMLSNKKGDN